MLCDHIFRHRRLGSSIGDRKLVFCLQDEQFILVVLYCFLSSAVV